MTLLNIDYEFNCYKQRTILYNDKTPYSWSILFIALIKILTLLLCIDYLLTII